MLTIGNKIERPKEEYKVHIHFYDGDRGFMQDDHHWEKKKQAEMEDFVEILKIYQDLKPKFNEDIEDLFKNKVKDIYEKWEFEDEETCWDYLSEFLIQDENGFWYLIDRITVTYFNENGDEFYVNF